MYQAWVWHFWQIHFHCNYFCHWQTISFCCCFLEQDNISHFAISPNCVPFLPTLKCCKNFFSPSTPKLISDKLYSSPMFTTINVYGAVKFPEGGITTLDFKVSRFIGLSGIMLLHHLINLLSKEVSWQSLPLQSVKCIMIRHLN